ncbi:MAG: aminopeptidase [Kiritimatiellae bacterium]|nr:aminopeptidase [Kiritimatiellia bacterium]
MTPFNLPKLIRDVFDPQPRETALFLVDLPTPESPESPDWQDRRLMAADWRAAFLEYGVTCPPILFFPATGANNGDLPLAGQMQKQNVCIADELAKVDIALAFTRYSATAPLAALAQKTGTLRVASLPGVLRRMEQTALAADYEEVARQADALAERLQRAESAQVIFSTGHELFFDLRFRNAHADNGRCRREQTPHLINLPSGEAYIVPYEGERGEPSQTAGEIPVMLHGETVLLTVKSNRITEVNGSSPEADRLRDLFAADPTRRNLAELGLGCNDCAVVSGVVLEDEKAGMHWAYGRSEHLGGTVGPSAFRDPSLVLHNDVVYAKDSPIGIRSLILTYPDHSEELIMENSTYL